MEHLIKMQRILKTIERVRYIEVGSHLKMIAEGQKFDQTLPGFQMRRDMPATQKYFARKNSDSDKISTAMWGTTTKLRGQTQ